MQTQSLGVTSCFLSSLSLSQWCFIHASFTSNRPGENVLYRLAPNATLSLAWAPRRLQPQRLKGSPVLEDPAAHRGTLRWPVQWSASETVSITPWYRSADKNYRDRNILWSNVQHALSLFFSYIVTVNGQRGHAECTCRYYNMLTSENSDLNDLSPCLFLTHRVPCKKTNFGLLGHR